MSVPDMDSLQCDTDIRGNHVYKNLWTYFVGEVFLVQHKDHNHEDCFALAILKSREIVGNVSHEISQITWLFIEHDGTIFCEVTGPRK